MHDAGCTEEREIDENTRRPGDILKRFKPTLTPHYFRHNYVTMLYEAGVDPLIAMKIVGHADYQTTANIYTHPVSYPHLDVYKRQLKGQLKQAAQQSTAYSYIHDGSFYLDVNTDHFLYESTTRRKIENNEQRQ